MCELRSKWPDMSRHPFELQKGGPQGGFLKKLLLVLALLSAAALVFLGYEQLSAKSSPGPAAIIGFVVLGTFLGLTVLSWLLYDTPHRQTVGGIWIASVTTVVFFLVADAIVGFILIKPLSPALVPDEYRHHKLLPDSYSTIQQKDFSYTQRVNKLGLRGAETTVKKPPGVFRILTLGDSFTMGKGVRDGETYSVFLEEMLNQAPGGSCKWPRFEVLNGGVDSYAPVLSNIELQRDLASLEPDLIIHSLDIGDLVQEAAYRSEAEYAPDGTVLKVPSIGRAVTATDRVRDWIDQHLFFTRALLYYASKHLGGEKVSVRTVATQANRELVAHTLAGDTLPREAQWRDIFASIDSIRTFAAAHRGEYVLGIYPWGHQVNATEWVPGRYAYLSQDDTVSDQSLVTIHKMAAERGIDLADMYPRFRAYAGNEKLYYTYDNHWTPAGQRLMAEGLAEHLRKSRGAAWCE
jgi:hypothetical protein